MADFPKEFAYELEIWTPDMAETSELEDTLSTLQERGVVAARGLTPELVAALGVVSNQGHIVEYCEDEPQRFGTENRARTWQEKGGEFFSFHDVDGFAGEPLSRNDLASVQEADLMLRMYGFARPKQNDHILGTGITTAFRATEMGLDRRLATPLIKFVMGATIQRHRLDPRMLSLDTWESNRDAVPLYERRGFTLVNRERTKRGTLHVPGTTINGHRVEIDPEKANRNIVTDYRLFMRHNPDDRYNIRDQRIS